MRKRVINIITWFFALIIAIFGGLGIHHLIATHSNLSKKEISFTVENEKGKRVSLDDFQGKPIVINFWAIWCPPCKAELPAFQGVYEEYRTEVDFLFINVLNWRGESKQDIKNFMDANDYSFPVYYDTKRSAEMTCEVESIPLTLFLNEEGDIVRSYSGSMSEGLLRSYIEQIL